jgi:hypothetical protein
MVEAKRAHTAETPKQPSFNLKLRASYFYPDRPLQRLEEEQHCCAISVSYYWTTPYYQYSGSCNRLLRDRGSISSACSNSIRNSLVLLPKRTKYGTLLK